MNKIRKGDEVIVITGRDKGKRGKITLRKDDAHEISWSTPLLDQALPHTLKRMRLPMAMPVTV